MLPTDRDVTLLADPVCTLYQQLEYDIIVEIAKRFATYDEATGQLEWLLQRLQHFQEINPALVKLFAKYSGKSEQEIRRMMEQAQRLNIDLDTLQGAYGAGNIGVDLDVVMNSPVLRDILESSHKELDATFRLIQTKAMESAQQTYMNILNTAYIETASGAYSMQESVKRSLQRAARKGITAATYKHTNPDGTVRYVNYSIEGVVRRDTRSAINKLANASSYKFAEELGAEYVEVSSHLGARVHPTNPIANHAGWQGGVYKINGSAPGYPNLKDSTGYPDDILGLAGVNCRHRIFPFFPGISVRNPICYGDTEENRRRYQAEQKQRQYERQIRALKKERAAMQIIGDQDAVATLTAKLRNRQSELQAHCDKYGLRRDYSRELVQEQVATLPLTKTANNGNVIGAKTSRGTDLRYNPSAIYEIDIEEYSDEVNKGLSEATAKVANDGYRDSLEHLELVNLDTGVSEYREIGTAESVGGPEFWKYIGKNRNKKYAFVHNHNTNSGFSETDLQTLSGDNNINAFVIARFDGSVDALISNGKSNGNKYLNSLYPEISKDIVEKMRAGDILPVDRARIREREIVDRAIKDYTKGMIKWKNGQRQR